MSFKEIHIGSLIKLRIEECEVEMSRICKFFACKEEDVIRMCESADLSGEELLKWSKLLEYDFFRIYSQHLIFFSPPSNIKYNIPQKENTALPKFRKNIYTKEIIDFILEKITNGDKTKEQVIKEYRIPKTTLYKWINKYKTN